MLATPLKRSPLLGLALAGLLLSLWLELLHVRAYGAPGSTSFCSFTSNFDCTSVALSRWSVIFGVPLPLWGALGFVALGVASFVGSALLVPLSIVAALASVALLGVELRVIGSVCLLCEGVHAMSLALAVLAWRNRRALVPASDRERSALVLLPPLGLLLAVVLFLPPYFRAVGFKGDLPFAQGVTAEGAPWIGARAPKLTLEEYTDYLCPHCKAATAWTLHRLAERPTEIRLVRRQLPATRCTLESQANPRCERVRLAYCAGEQGRFWQMDRWLFAHGDELKLDARTAAREVGLEPTRAAQCVERADIYARATRESEAAWKHRFMGTPTYVVDGKRIPPETADRFLAQGRAD